MLQENQKRELVLIEDLGMLFPTEKSNHKKRIGLYKCYCGNEFKTRVQAVKSGNTKSCGCHKQEFLITHGLTKHTLYKVWSEMIQRCTNSNNKRYKYYGGRGITVCDEWLNINNFIEDMYPTYQDGLSIDRIDVNGNYCKDNCRWTTREIQARNTRLLKSTNTSGYRGVSFDKRVNKFMSQIRVNSKPIFLGLFANALDGAKAYNNYVISNNLEHTLNLV